MSDHPHLPHPVTGWERVRMIAWYFFMRPQEVLVVRWADRKMRRQRALVDNRVVGKTVLIIETIWFFGALFLFAGDHWINPPPFIDSLITVFIGLTIGRGCYALLFNQMVFRTGWIKGRAAMVHSMGEAQRRGMDPNDWLKAELDRDAAMLFGIYQFDLADDDEERNDGS